MQKNLLGYRSCKFSLTIPKMPDVFIVINTPIMCDTFNLRGDDVGKHHRWHLEMGKHSASGEKATVRSTVMTVLIRQSLDEKLPRVGNACRRIFGALLHIPSMSSNSRPLALLARISSCTQCNTMHLSCFQTGADLSTYQTISSLSQKNAHLQNVISIKREQKQLKMNKMCLRMAKGITQGHRASKEKSYGKYSGL